MEKFYRAASVAGGVNEDGIIHLNGHDEFGMDITIYYIHAFTTQAAAYKFLVDLCTASFDYMVPSYDREGYEREMENWTFEISEVYERFGMEVSA